MIAGQLAVFATGGIVGATLALLAVRIGLARAVDRVAGAAETGASPMAGGPAMLGLGRLAGLLDDQRRRIDDLTETDRLRNAIFAASPNAIVISDREGRVLGFNPAAERVFGLGAADALRARMSDLIAPDDASVLAADFSGNILDTLGTGGLEARRGDGTLFPAEVALQRVGTGDRLRFVAYVRDLTDRLRAEAEQEDHRQRLHQTEKLAAMGSLLGGVAHELNNPLAILVTQATLLREKAPTPDVARRAERIHAAAQRAGRIVKSFLAMARQKPPVREPIDLNAVVEAATELVGYGLRSAGIAVETRLDPALPPVDGDRDLLGQVVANVLLNAQQALLHVDGPRRVTVTTALTGEAVTIAVTDNGPGIPKTVQGRIFEPYFTTKPAGAGTGIGLAICASVVEAHDGRIAVDSSEGRGACFTISLPAVPAGARVVGSDAIDPRTLSILVVDDEPDVAASLAELLGLFGHRVVVSSSGQDALERIRRQRFDAVFTDLRMPGMNGLALRHAVGDLDPSLAENTVIVTGDTVMGPERGHRPDSPDGLVLEKPFTAAELKSLLGQVASR